MVLLVRGIRQHRRHAIAILVRNKIRLIMVKYQANVYRALSMKSVISIAFLVIDELETKPSPVNVSLIYFSFTQLTS